MTPEELLRQTSATNRAAYQQKQTQQQKIRSRQNPHAVALPYDGDRGLQQIQLSDGSIRDAESNSNGVIGEGDTVALHQGKGRSRVNVMPHKPRQRQPITPQSTPPGSVKVLFSVVREGIRKFYVGGDRPTPTKIGEFDANIFFDNPGIPGTGAPILTNLGKGKNQWLAGSEFFGGGTDGGVVVFIPNATTKIINPSDYLGNGTGFFYLGSGFSFIGLQDLDSNYRHRSYSFLRGELVDEFEITYPEEGSDIGHAWTAALPHRFVEFASKPIIVQNNLERSLYQRFDSLTYEVIDSAGNVITVSGFTNFKANRSSWIGNSIYVTPTKEGQPSILSDMYAQKDASIEIEVYGIGETGEIIKTDKSIQAKVRSLKLSSSDNFVIHSASYSK
jgi:hypothetical protein